MIDHAAIRSAIATVLQAGGFANVYEYDQAVDANQAPYVTITRESTTPNPTPPSGRYEADIAWSVRVYSTMISNDAQGQIKAQQDQDDLTAQLIAAIARETLLSNTIDLIAHFESVTTDDSVAATGSRPALAVTLGTLITSVTVDLL